MSQKFEVRAVLLVRLLQNSPDVVDLERFPFHLIVESGLKMFWNQQ
jgi:hypothetical protein